MNDIMETIKALKVPNAYDISYAEANAIYAAAAGDSLELLHYAFCYGYLKGQRAEKATARKKRAKRAEVAA